MNNQYIEVKVIIIDHELKILVVLLISLLIEFTEIGSLQIIVGSIIKIMLYL